MDIAQYRRHAHRLVDWMADYLETVESRPVRSAVAPGEIEERLPDRPPETGEPFERIFADFERDLLPGVTHWQHPSFFAYFPANSSPPSVLAEMLTAALGLNCMLWQTSPAGTELETRALDWLRQMIGLPEGFAGVIQDTASSATLCAILAARERATEFAANRRGVSGEDRLTVYTSAESHSSVEKAVRIAGLGSESLRAVPVGADGAMRCDALAEALERDVAAGARPILVVATLGTTGASGFDRLDVAGELCRRHGAMLHVDAAWAGTAAIAPEFRWMLEGVEHADSFVVNPHKWMMVNFDCSAHFVRDPAAFVRTFEIVPEYLRTAEHGRVIDYRDWGIALGRRFRALKLWFVIRSYGVEGLRAIVRRHVGLAGELAEAIAREDDFEVVVAPRLALLCFRYRPSGIDDPAALDELNERLLHTLNDSGRLYLTQTRVAGAYVIRFCVGQTVTERRHVETAWSFIREAARGLPR
ncbi:MAG: pyridoxal-dependent decarboxylase [Immundisolibacterales bacterium]|nr:pyridoxal-dependent decarboxylase [Immundisolibacterales bacterium]